MIDADWNRCSEINDNNNNFFFNDTATTEIYTLSLHDALPIFPRDPALGLFFLSLGSLSSEDGDADADGKEQ